MYFYYLQLPVLYDTFKNNTRPFWIIFIDYNTEAGGQHSMCCPPLPFYSFIPQVYPVMAMDPRLQTLLNTVALSPWAAPRHTRSGR